MYSIRTWFSLILCLVGLYISIFFDDFIIDLEYVDDAITTKNRAIRSIIYSISQNKYGYWVIRLIPAIVGLSFGKSFIDSIRKKN